MNEQELIDLLKCGEGITIEFKSQFPKSASTISKEMVAFANTQGGTLFVGINDDASIVGISSNFDQIIQRIAGLARNSCKPPINPEIGHLHIDGKCVIWVKVRHEALPRSSDDKYYIRVGSTVRVASSDELVSMFTGNKYDAEVLRRLDALFKNFRPENLVPVVEEEKQIVTNLEGEQRRVSIYQENRGLFLIHVWQPSRTPGQVADISIMLCQHGTGPLVTGLVETVEYYLGPKFFGYPVVKANADENFRLYVSAYSPVLCLARVNFKDNSPSLYLQRYCDF